MKSIGARVISSVSKKTDLLVVANKNSNSGKIKKARELGIDEQNAKILAEKTFIGSAHLLEKSHENVQDLRKAVTSPKGTTEAGLGILIEEDVFFNLTHQAIKKAQKRGKELGKS